MPQDASLRDLYVEFSRPGRRPVLRRRPRRCSWSPSTGGIGPAEEITYAHEYTHPLQDQTFDLDKLGQGHRPERSVARPATLIEGDATLLMSTGRSSTSPRPSCSQVSRRRRPGVAGGARRCPRSCARRPCSRTAGAQAVLGAFTSAGGYAGVDAAVRQPARLDRAGPPPREAQPARAPVEVTLPDDLAKRLGAGWVPAPGHARRAPAAHLARRRGRRGQRDGPGRGGGLGRRSPGPDRGPDGATAWCSHRVGHRADAAEFAAALAGIVPKLQAPAERRRS